MFSISQKLYAQPGDFHAYKCLIAAQYNGIAIDMPSYDRSKDATAKWFLEKNPLGKDPLLDTPDGKFVLISSCSLPNPGTLLAKLRSTPSHALSTQHQP